MLDIEQFGQSFCAKVFGVLSTDVEQDMLDAFYHLVAHGYSILPLTGDLDIEDKPWLIAYQLLMVAEIGDVLAT